MKAKYWVAGLLAVVPSAVPAMPADQFLSRAEALKAKGFTALFSSDYKVLMNAVKADSTALKAEREAAQSAHQTPAYCPPGPVGLSSDDIIAAMRAVPAADRARTDSRAALRSFLAKRYPCRG